VLSVTSIGTRDFGGSETAQMILLMYVLTVADLYGAQNHHPFPIFANSGLC